MILAFAVAPECRVQVVEAEITSSPAGWEERTRLEVAASPSCQWIEVPLPGGVTLAEARAQERLGDGTRRKLGPERWEAGPRAIDGGTTTRLHTPDLVSGDRVFVDVVRRVSPGPVRFEPGPAGYASVQRDGGDLVWKADAPAGWGVDLDDGQARPPTAVPLPAGDVRVERHVSLILPPGDPQVVLYPGGGSSARIEDFLTVPPAEEPRAWALHRGPPPGVPVEVTSEPSGQAEVRDGFVWLAPSSVPVKVRVAWEEPDAPTFGERDPEWDALEVRVDGGSVRWEGDGWFLHRASGEVVLPDRAALQRALDARFRATAFPEPGAPMELRGHAADWSVAVGLRDALHARASVEAGLSLDPLFPRRLGKAMRSGALTPVEAGFVTWLYARQLTFEADWFLVRPASRGPAAPTSASGYDAALVRVVHDGEARWIDPSCAVCAPFELPPDLEGGSLLGPRDAEAPAPTPGRSVLTEGADRLDWRFEGPAALEIRAWLADIPPAEREAALAHRFGGPGATILELTGVGDAGQPIAMALTRGTGLRPDPLASAPAAATVWWPWIGERVLRRPGAAAPAAQAWPDMRYERVQDGQWVEERLTVGRREVPVADARALDALRVSPPGSAPSPP